MDSEDEDIIQIAAMDCEDENSDNEDIIDICSTNSAMGGSNGC